MVQCDAAVTAVPAAAAAAASILTTLSKHMPVQAVPAWRAPMPHDAAAIVSAAVAFAAQVGPV